MVRPQATLCSDAKEPDNLAQDDRSAKKQYTCPRRQSMPPSEIAAIKLLEFAKHAQESKIFKYGFNSY
jgi:hypothetical protein